MNLAIDIGNTCIKASLFKDENFIELKTAETLHDLLLHTEFINKANKAIIASVVDGVETVYEALHTLMPTQVFNSETKTPLINLYQSHSTLGSDRLLASIGAYCLYPHANVLVIDAGTCIKYNFTNSHNEYLGGGISPGIQMRFKALNHFTDKLPFIEADFLYKDLIGTTTKTSILSGVLNGCVAEVDGIITHYKEQYPQLICVLTGGDSEYLAKRLKNSIFAHQNLVLKGLNHILNYNLEKK